MAASNGVTAYDFSFFESSAAAEQRFGSIKYIIRIPEEQLEINRRKHYRPTTVIATFLLFAITASVLATMIYSQVRLTELTEQINAANKQLEESKSITTQLEMKVEAKLSLREVEEYAQNTLGMTKTEASQIHYIQLSEGDKEEVVETEEQRSFLDKLSDMLSGLLP